MDQSEETEASSQKSEQQPRPAGRRSGASAAVEAEENCREKTQETQKRSASTIHCPLSIIRYLPESREISPPRTRGNAEAGANNCRTARGPRMHEPEVTVPALPQPIPRPFDRQTLAEPASNELDMSRYAVSSGPPSIHRNLSISLRVKSAKHRPEDRFRS